MSTHVPGFQLFYGFLSHYFVLTKISTSSPRVNSSNATHISAFVVI